MSRFRAALGILRDINAVDLLLPIGGALIASGMHNLAEREARQRHRLAALQTSVQTNLDALLSAGVDVPAELAVDERHPLDAPGLAGAVNGITGNDNPKISSNSYPDGRGVSSSRRRGWKLAALALAGAAGVAYAFRGQLAEIVLPYLDAAGADDERAADFAAAAFRGEVDPVTMERRPPSPWDQAEPVDEVKPDLTPEPEPEPAAAAEPEPEPGPLVAGEIDECGWPGCTWMPKDTTRGAARVTALAVHRSRCVFRPPSMSVPGA